MPKSIILDKKKSATLTPQSPYNFNYTFHKPSHFPTQNIKWEKNIFYQSFIFKNKYCGLKYENKGTIAKPKIKLSIYYKDKLNKKQITEIINEVKWRYDFETDFSEFFNKFKKDRILKDIIKKFKGMRISCDYSLYEFLIVCIVLQNATVRRSVQMMQNLFDKYGKKVRFDSVELNTFWLPKRLNKVSEDELRTLKIGYRAKFLKRISKMFANKEINEYEIRKLGKDKAKEELIKLYGIGPASVWYILFEVYHHYDAFDYISPWEQKIYSKLIFNKALVSTDRILNYFKKTYGKYRMLAAHYIFEDIFWKRKHEHIEWLEKEIRL